MASSATGSASMSEVREEPSAQSRVSVPVPRRSSPMIAYWPSRYVGTCAASRTARRAVGSVAVSPSTSSGGRTASGVRPGTSANPARTTPSVTVPSAGWPGSSGTVRVPQSARRVRSVGIGTSRLPSRLGVQSLTGRVACWGSGAGSGVGAPAVAAGGAGRSARTATGGRVDGPIEQAARSPTASRADRTEPIARRRATRATCRTAGVAAVSPRDRTESHLPHVLTCGRCDSRRSRRPTRPAMSVAGAPTPAGRPRAASSARATRRRWPAPRRADARARRARRRRRPAKG